MLPTVLPSTEVTSSSQPSILAITAEDVSNKFNDFVKNTQNDISYQINEGFAKLLRNMNVASTSAAIPVNAQSSSASPTLPVENPQYGMPLNYFNGQTPPAQGSILNKNNSGGAIVFEYSNC